ncbi:transposase domain-containing protein [Anatilimnocola sp. NA78]|uniref:transposase domain-containing protein n=1 Tax=Anatilimnocola sp. NA78 TaxID=3415683 RepID=UPI003CE465AD
MLDRLAALEKLLLPDVVRSVLQATDKINERSRPLTHEVMLQVVLAMGVFTDFPICRVFRQARRCQRAPVRSSLCLARMVADVPHGHWRTTTFVVRAASHRTDRAVRGRWPDQRFCLPGSKPTPTSQCLATFYSKCI